MRTISEAHNFSREQLESMAKNWAKSHIIGTLFIGEFHHQQCRWSEDGSLQVITSYSQGSWDDTRRPSVEDLPKLPRTGGLDE